MKWGVIFVNSGPFSEPDNAVALAQAAEEAGFESLWTVEHVVVPAGYESEYPYSRSGKMPGGEDVPIPDPLIWLSYVAAATSRINLGTGILILPQRNPVVLAKATATLDRLSGGRLRLGVGVGWLEEEFDALGVPFEGRGQRTDEYVEVLRTLWAQGEASHHGEHVNFENLNMYPKPADGSIPVIVGGHTAVAARRAGRTGDGFFPGRGRLEELAPLFDEVRKAAAEAGRDPDSIELTAGGAMDPEGIKPFADLGVERMVIPPLAFDPDGLREALARFGDEVISKTS
jgi:probable F420-dependent oxidoreductase